jgi:DNA gyrase, A subunit
MVDQDRIIKINIEEEMKSAYIDYSMSVIVSRALPDVRDGFKPVHRRVLFGMNELGNTSDKPYKKSARIVGEVLGKYHPHGDSSVYHAMVRMAQVWSLRYPLVDGQGNFGSVDGDSPAAMRYTEARLSKLAEEMLRDIEKDTVDFQLNFDDTLKEPTVLPTRIPNLLVNGASGIAVGMATNMPPHNMSEVLDASMAYIDAKGDVDVEGLMEYVKAPDFPTGATIYGYKGVKDAFETGKGRVIIRGKAEVESDGNHEKIVITEIPYLVNKAELIKKIAELVNAKRLDGISNVNDESDRTGMRIVVDVKRDANSNVVINKLYKMTELQSSFVVNNIALVNGRPRLLNLKEMIKAFVDHRQDVVIRRTRFELKKAEDRAHILQGLIIASDNIDEVIAIIKASTSPQEAIANLIARFELSEIQARAIVEMRLRQLTGLEQSKLRAEYEEIEKLIAYLKEILENEDLCMSVIKEELEEVKKKYGDTRKTDIVYQSEEMTPEDFYADDEMIITISRMGYIKRTPLSEFRAQNRGGVGARGSNTRDEDFIEHMYSASMHNHILFFTQKGKCYWLKVFEIPEGSKTSKGRAIQNMLNIDIDDKVTAYVRVKKLTTDEDFVNSHYLFFCTKNGMIKRTSLKAFSRPNRSGVLSMTLMGDDRLIEVLMTNGDCDILLANRNGKAIRFKESAVRITSRRGLGVKGMKLQSDDCIVGMLAMDKEDQADKTVMVVSELGFGKRTRLNDDDGEAIYRVANRGGQGVKTLNITEKTGKLVSICSVNDEHDLMIINKSGIIIRLRVADIRTSGRVTQGLKLLNLGKRNDQIASICKVLADPDEELENDETAETADGTLAEGNVDTHDKNEESEEQNKED